MRLITSLRNLPGRLAGLLVRPASAHCDTADGSAATDGHRAQEPCSF